MIDVGSAVNLIALVLCVVFITYVLSIVLPFLRRGRDDTGDPADFEWHFVLPCLNEEAVIGRSLARLRRDHPHAEIWCVDDDSTDGTAEILAALASRDPAIHVITRRAPRARTGKGDALNEAWQQLSAAVRSRADSRPATQTIVGILDADARLAPDALRVLAGPSGFLDDAVGAVQIQVRMINRGLPRRPDGDDPAPVSRRGRLLVMLQDLEFRTVISAMQHFRHGMFSAGMGGNGQFSRLSTLNAVALQHGSPWHGSLLEDYEFGIHVLLVGLRTRYCNDAWVAQEGLPNLRALVRQRARWAQGGMQCAAYLKAVLTSPRVSTASAFEITYFLFVPWTQILGTVVYGAAFIELTSSALASPGGVIGWLSSGAWAVGPLIALFGIMPLGVWGFVYRSRCEPTMSRRRAALLALCYWGYSYVMLTAVWVAFGRLLMSRHSWAKTRRVAEMSAVAAGGRHRA